MREVALALAEKGFRVFPVVAGEKIPRIKDFPNVASSDPDFTRRFWSAAVTDEDEGHNIGIATGYEIMVLDFDVKAGQPGLEDLAHFEAIGLDTSVQARTASGGIHVFLRLPPSTSVAGSVKKILPGTDVRGYHGYVVGPGSKLDSGGDYRWINQPSSIDDIPFAPDWLIKLCGAPIKGEKDAHLPPPMGWDQSEDIARAINYLKNAAPEGISDFNGNDTVFLITMKLRNFGISDGQAAWLILDHWNETKAIPSWPPDELYNLIIGMHGRGKKRPGSEQRIPAEVEFFPHDGLIGDLPGADRAATAQTRSAAPTAASQSATIESQESTSAERSTKPQRLQLETFDEAATAAARSRSNYVVKDMLDAGATSVFYGPPNSGKTFVVLELARCIGTGLEFAGRATSRGAVLYIALEGVRGLRWRLAALKKHRPTEEPLPLVLATGSLDLFADKKAFTDLLAAIKDTEKQTGLPVKLVVIDTLARAMTGGNENDTEDMTKIVDAAIRAAQQTGAHVMLVHHTGKDASKGARGAYVLTGNIDSSFEIQPDKQQPGQPASGKIINIKSRDNERQPPIGFRLEKVTAGVDADLNTVTSCLVEFPVKLCRPASSLPKKLRLAVLALDRATENGVRSVATGDWDNAMDAIASELGLSKLTDEARSSLRRRAKTEGFASTNADKTWSKISADDSRQNGVFSE